MARNQALAPELEEVARKSEAELFLPHLEFCADNGAMIELAGAHMKAEKTDGGFDICPRWPPDLDDMSNFINNFILY